jgi:glutathione S-transferase
LQTPTDNQGTEAPLQRLALYHFDYCPYCVDVRAEIERLGLPVELRDIHRQPDYARQLIAVRGRPTVPVLRIDGADGMRWLPESLDIITYLRALRPDQVRPPLWMTVVGRWLHWGFALAALLFGGGWGSISCGVVAAVLLFRRYKRF